MNYKIIIFILINIYGGVALSEEYAYVIGSIVNIRDAYKPNARIVAKVPIGTRLSKGSKKGDWVHVYTPGYNSGWIHTSLLSNIKPKADILIDEYKNTPLIHLDTRRKLIERAAGLEPWNIKSQEIYYDLLVELGDLRIAEIIKNNIEYIKDPGKYTSNVEPRAIFLYANNSITPLAILDSGIVSPPYLFKEERDNFVKQYLKVGKMYNLISKEGVQLSDDMQLIAVRYDTLNQYGGCASEVNAKVRNKKLPPENIYHGFITNFDTVELNQKLTANISKKLIHKYSDNIIKSKKNFRWQKQEEAIVSVIDINHDGEPELFTVKKYLYDVTSENENDAGYYAVVLWEKNHDEYEPTYSTIYPPDKGHHYVPSYTFYGNVDIDGDGIDEIITENGVYEGSRYSIHTFNKGRWRDTNIGPEYGPC